MQKTSQPQYSGRSNKKGSAGPMFVFILIIALLCGTGVFFAQNYVNNLVHGERAGSGETITVVIPQGQSTANIADLLVEKKVIENSLLFQGYVQYSGNRGKLQAGTYQFKNTESLDSVVSKIAAEVLEADHVKVRVPENLRSDEVVTILALGLKSSQSPEVPADIEDQLTDIVNNPDKYKFGAETDAFLAKNKPTGKPLEGFLYPDTYDFYVTLKPTEIINVLLENFITKTKDLPVAQKYTYYQYLTLASIVAREANPGEYDEISGILIRRLNSGSMLGADATVLYPYKRWSPEPNARELAVNTKYNTRLNTGLPITPISNTTADVMEGTWNTPASVFDYYLHGLDGNLYTAKTYEEHQANIQKYLR